MFSVYWYAVVREFGVVVTTMLGGCQGVPRWFLWYSVWLSTCYHGV